MRISPVMSAAGSTIVVGLNGALQKRFVLPPKVQLIPGDVHRAANIHVGVGGKGQDVAVALSCLDYQGDLKLAQFVGQDGAGDRVHDMLKNLLGTDAMELTVRPASVMRTCTSIVASDSTTELVEPSGEITADELDKLIDGLSQKQASALCIMGSMLPGCTEATYADIYQAVATPGTLCLIDSVAGLEPLLEKIASTSRGDTSASFPTLLKVNAAELCRLAGVSRTASETSGTSAQEIAVATKEFLQKYSPFAAQALTAIAITDGKHSAYVAMISPDHSFELHQLPVAEINQENDDTPLYPIGAGDAVAAGTLAAWKFLTDSAEAKCSLPSAELQEILSKGKQLPLSATSSEAIVSAFAFGLICGTASCLQEENSKLAIEDIVAFQKKVARPSLLTNAIAS